MLVNVANGQFRYFCHDVCLERAICKQIPISCTCELIGVRN